MCDHYLLYVLYAVQVELSRSCQRLLVSSIGQDGMKQDGWMQDQIVVGSDERWEYAAGTSRRISPRCVAGWDPKELESSGQTGARMFNINAMQYDTSYLHMRNVLFAVLMSCFDVACSLFLPCFLYHRWIQSWQSRAQICSTGSTSCYSLGSQR